MSAVASIRPATPTDLTAIGQLGALLVRMHHDLDPQRFIPATPQTERAFGSFLGTQLDEPNIAILVAERDSEVIGYAYAGMEEHDYMALRGPAGALYDIVVDPAIAGVASVGCCSMRLSRRSRPEVRPALYSRRRSRTKWHSVCSLERVFGGR